MLDLVVRGGRVVTPSAVALLDVGIAGEKIVLLAAPGHAPPGLRTVSAAGRIVVPGGIEPHAHMAFRLSQHPDEDLESLGPEDDTLGMVFGGVTTHLDFCWVLPGSPVADSLRARAQRWTGRSRTDYSFHIALLGRQEMSSLDEIPRAVADGFTSIKVFTNDVLPPHPRRRSVKMDFGRLAAILERAADAGAVVAVHAEDDDIVQFGYERTQAEGRTSAAHLHEIHDELSERLAFRRTIDLAARRGAALYFVHTSAREGVDAIAEARAAGLPVYGETLHQYLCHTDAAYSEADGIVHHTYPSLKAADDRDALWDGLMNDVLSTVATDEVPTTRAIKLKGRRSDDVTGGNLGAEARMGIVYTDGVAKRGMSLQRYVEVTSTNAARIFGLYPRKGVIALGADADLAILDPTPRTLARADFHVADYSPWEGWSVAAWPTTTILRGTVVVEDGRLVTEAPGGSLIPRRVDRAVLEGPVC